MFWPYTGESDARVRSVRRDALLSGQGFAYIARDGEGRPLGSLLFVPSVFLSPLLVCEKMVYLWEGFVEADHRTGGLGSMLLDHAMAGLRARGIQSTLYLGAAFKKKNPTEMEAHAWLRCGPLYVTGGEIYRQFGVVGIYG